MLINIAALSLGQDLLDYNHIEVALSPAMRPYCHLVAFPGGWGYQPKTTFGQTLWFDNGQYEFRVEGPPAATTLIGAYEVAVSHRYDAAHHFRIDLSNPGAKPVPVTQEEWDAAAVVRLTRKSVFASVPQSASTDPARLMNREFVKNGARWALAADASWLSPDGTWLVLQSATAKHRSTNGPSEATLFLGCV
jgi:hypothetical protein